MSQWVEFRSKGSNKATLLRQRLKDSKASRVVVINALTTLALVGKKHVGTPWLQQMAHEFKASLLTRNAPEPAPTKHAPCGLYILEAGYRRHRMGCAKCNPDRSKRTYKPRKPPTPKPVLTPATQEPVKPTATPTAPAPAAAAPVIAREVRYAKQIEVNKDARTGNELNKLSPVEVITPPSFATLVTRLQRIHDISLQTALDAEEAMNAIKSIADLEARMIVQQKELLTTRESLKSLVMEGD